MDCKTIMVPIKVSLYEDELVGSAIDFMSEKHMGMVPVVDRDNRFVGLLSGDRLMHNMLPHSLGMMRGEKRLSYLREDRSELQERLDRLRGKSVGDLVDRDVKVAHPDAPIVDALVLISGKQFVVPVVDDDEKLVGAISFFSVLHSLKEVDE